MKRVLLTVSLITLAFFNVYSQRDSTIRTLTFTANTVYFLNGLLINTGDEDLKDLTRRWYKQCNVANPPMGTTEITVSTDAETVYKLSAVIRQFPLRLIASQWSEISTGISNSAAGYQPLIDRIASLDTNDATDRAAIRQAGRKDAQGRL